MTTYNVDGGACAANGSAACGSASLLPPYYANGSACTAHGAAACGIAELLLPPVVNASACAAHGSANCPVVLQLTPNGALVHADYSNIVFRVWSRTGPLRVDNADVEFVLKDAEDNVIFTKSTTAYSIETAGSTLAVHINPEDPVSYQRMYYTVTIIIGESLSRLGVGTYTMTGELFIEPISSVYRLFGLFPHPGVQLLGMPQAEVRLLGTPQEPEPRSGFGTLTITNPRMLGTQPKTSVRLFGMLQEIEKN